MLDDGGKYETEEFYTLMDKKYMEKNIVSYLMNANL